MIKNKKYLISFGSPDLKRSIKRFYEQSRNLNYYDDIKVFTVRDLTNSNFISIKNLIDKKKVGYGYWYWKPLIIKQFLEKINNNDIVNYIDLGCHFNSNGKKKLNFFEERLNNSKDGFLAFQFYPLKGYDSNIYEYPNRNEYLYTKADAFEYFKVLNQKEFTHTQQFCASYIFLKKNLFSINLIDQWIDVFEKRFDLINNNPSKIPNFKDFIYNTHDQSIYSLLCKSHKVENLSAFEFDWFYYKNKRYWEHTQNSPIIAKRDKKFNIFKRFLIRQNKTINRFKNKFFKQVY